MQIVTGVVIGTGIFASVPTSGSALSEDFTSALQVSATQLDRRYEQDVRICPIWEAFSTIEGPQSAVSELEVWFRSDQPMETPIALRMEDSPYETDGVLSEPIKMTKLRLEVPADDALAWEPCSPWVTIEIGPRMRGPDDVNIIWPLRTEATVETHGVSFPGTSDVPEAYFELRSRR
jgi:hypothetical protein